MGTDTGKQKGWWAGEQDSVGRWTQTPIIGPDGAGSACPRKTSMAARRRLPPVAIDRGVDDECDVGDDQ